MKAHNLKSQTSITPDQARELLKEKNEEFVGNVSTLNVTRWLK